ncbi:hypothetical protein PENNAL_c0709G05251 [Penicillium nalgiovense]|uniref:Uncharacterized protein n=1 Tax=Penicillium nalgiovense TaxID=60175 RepID=A0A1V6UVK6_PENNA|nr:hypothetical protein PENNAL_c0709G05251 [Penicillium nalgiovense]
MRAAHRWHG